MLWKINKFEFDLDNIELWLMSDIHLGHQDCNIRELQRYIDYIAARDNAYVIGLGDYIECVTSAKHPSGNAFLTQEINPNNQVRKIVELLEPIKDRILCLLEGNHEQRITKASQIDITELIADKLGTLYLGYEGFVRLQFSRYKYHDLYITHGSSGSQYPESELKRYFDLLGHLVDIIAIGHNHRLFRYDYPIYDRTKLSIDIKKVIGLRTGTFLNFPRYAREKGYRADEVANVILRLDADTVQCALGLDKITWG